MKDSLKECLSLIIQRSSILSFFAPGRVRSNFFGHISGTGNVTFKLGYDCQNRFSHLREQDVSLLDVGLKVTFSVISPEAEVAAMIHSNLIYGHTVAFKRVQDCRNRFSHFREKYVSS